MDVVNFLPRYGEVKMVLEFEALFGFGSLPDNIPVEIEALFEMM